MGDSSDNFFDEYDKSNKIFSDAIGVSFELLRKNKFFIETNEDTMSRLSAHLGLEIFENIKKLRDEFMYPDDGDSTRSMYCDKQKVSSESNKSELKNKFMNKNYSLERACDDEIINTTPMTTISTEIPCDPLDSENNEVIKESNCQTTLDYPVKTEIQETFQVDCDFFDELEENDTISNDIKPKIVHNDDDINDDENNENYLNKPSEKPQSKVVKRKLTSNKNYTKLLIANIEKKIKAVNLARENPQMSLVTIQRRIGCKKIRQRDIACWIKQIQTGGSLSTQTTMINQWVLAKCREFEDKKIKITVELLKQWAIEGNKILFSKFLKRIKFIPSSKWLIQFKRRHNIQGESSNLYIEDRRTKISNGVRKSPRIMDTTPRIKRADLFKQETKINSFTPENPTTSLNRSKEQNENNEVVNDEIIFPCTWNVSTPTRSLNRSKEQNDNNEMVDDEIISPCTKRTLSGKSSDKRKILNDWVYEKCIDYKTNGYQITDKILVVWGLDAKKKLNIADSQFCAGPKWLRNFKFNHNISGDAFDLKLES